MIAGRGLPAQLKCRRGFSLIELVLVLAIMGLFGAAAAPAMSRSFAGFRLYDAARRVSSELRLAQQRAITESQNWRVTIHNKDNGNCVKIFEGTSTSPYRILTMEPGVLIISATFGGGTEVVFSPSSAPSAGGTIVIGNTRGDTKLITVSPTTGRVKIQDP
jgi:prepilin-type N-terminal cleavage/methylation domain-containing protein